MYVAAAEIELAHSSCSPGCGEAGEDAGGQDKVTRVKSVGKEADVNADDSRSVLDLRWLSSLYHVDAFGLKVKQLVVRKRK